MRVDRVSSRCLCINCGVSLIRNCRSTAPAAAAAVRANDGENAKMTGTEKWWLVCNFRVRFAKMGG